eukprot:5400527-Pyramimonas_sp.AAC.1
MADEAHVVVPGGGFFDTLPRDSVQPVFGDMVHDPLARLQVVNAPRVRCGGNLQHGEAPVIVNVPHELVIGGFQYREDLPNVFPLRNAVCENLTRWQYPVRVSLDMPRAQSGEVRHLQNGKGRSREQPYWWCH